MWLGSQRGADSLLCWLNALLLTAKRRDFVVVKTTLGFPDIWQIRTRNLRIACPSRCKYVDNNSHSPATKPVSILKTSRGGYPRHTGINTLLRHHRLSFAKSVRQELHISSPPSPQVAGLGKGQQFASLLGYLKTHAL